MALIKQIFNLNKQINEYNEMVAKTEDMMFTREEFDAYGKKLEKKQQKIGNLQTKLQKTAATESIAVASFIYNYSAKTTRFGLRGQDIQDQLKLQDKFVNKAFGIAAATVVAGPVGGALALVGSVVSEIISVSIQNQAYEYNRQIDMQQKAIRQERVGRAVYNSSRRQ